MGVFGSRESSGRAPYPVPSLLQGRKGCMACPSYQKSFSSKKSHCKSMEKLRQCKVVCQEADRKAQRHNGESKQPLEPGMYFEYSDGWP